MGVARRPTRRRPSGLRRGSPVWFLGNAEPPIACDWFVLLSVFDASIWISVKTRKRAGALSAANRRKVYERTRNWSEFAEIVPRRRRQPRRWPRALDNRAEMRMNTNNRRSSKRPWFENARRNGASRAAAPVNRGVLNNHDKAKSAADHARARRRQPRVLQPARRRSKRASNSSPSSKSSASAIRSCRSRRRRTARCSRARTPAATPSISAPSDDAIDGLVICLPNFGDEIAIIELVDRGEARRSDPAAGEQRRDRQGRRRQPPRRLLRQVLGRQQLLSVRRARSPTRRATPRDVDGEEFAADLDRFVRVCRVVRGLKRARIGAIGARTGAVPDHALQREAVAGLRPDGGHRRPLRDHLRRQGARATTRRR